ncbi:hypothetical protein ID866_4508 [Astraeus odoratus]|nr:hypothetical protein ID866_4508 [Astraeus odoratus]
MRSNRVSAVYESDPPVKSLTPQRKHRKLLKDGSSEVWPEEIERIFVQGLREYWDSPWATFSRGRSRWRNQFLVDYLQKHGIDRSKKQVASHIQVLRNMWKGEPEYKLVAGGDELFLETNIKSEDPTDSLLTPAVYDEYSPASDRSGGSAASVCPPRSLYPGSSPSVCSTTELAMPHLTARVPTADDKCRRLRSFSPPEFSRAEPRRLSPLSATSWSPDVSTPSTVQSCPADVYTSLSETLDSAVPFSPAALQQPSHVDSPLVFPDTLSSVDRPVSVTRVVRLSLWAEGMQSYSIPVDSLVPPTQPSVDTVSAVALYIKLHLPPIDAPCSPGLHGFQASVTCVAQSSSSFRCSTSVLVRNQCVSQEIGFCSPVVVEPTGLLETTGVTLLLPDSALSRSRWLDSASPTRIVQKIFANDELVAILFYDLDRGQCENMPSAELSGAKKCLNRAEKTPSPLATYHVESYLPTYTHVSGQCIPRASLPTQTSLSYALSPVSTNTTSGNLSPYSAVYMTPSLLS